MKEVKDNLIQTKLDEFASNNMPSKNVILSAQYLCSQPKEKKAKWSLSTLLKRVLVPVFSCAIILVVSLYAGGIFGSTPNPTPSPYQVELTSTLERVTSAKEIATSQNVMMFDFTPTMDVNATETMPNAYGKSAGLIKFTIVDNTKMFLYVCDRNNSYTFDSTSLTQVTSSKLENVNNFLIDGAILYANDTSAKLIYKDVTYYVILDKNFTTNVLDYVNLLKFN